MDNQHGLCAKKCLKAGRIFMYHIFIKNSSNHASSQTEEANYIPAKVHNACSSIYANNNVFFIFKQTKSSR